jgi:hypothetical protein
VKRYVKVQHSAAGATTVTVTLVDGELSASWGVKSYLNDVGAATIAADKAAHQAMDKVRAALEEQSLGVAS